MFEGIHNNSPVEGDTRDELDQMSIDSERTMTVSGDSSPILWGYGVQDHLRNSEASNAQELRVFRAKLLLDESDDTRIVRERLGPPLRSLRARKLIKRDEDVISDFLVELLCHTKNQLSAHHGWNAACTTEWILTVPAMWKPKALRSMQRLMGVSLQKSGFDAGGNNSLTNLFIVTEPEAAAASLLARNPDFHIGVSRKSSFMFNAFLTSSAQ
jgi:hypothetical protein